MIIELYDGTPPENFSAATPRLLNVSVLKPIAAGEILTAGFVLAGTTEKTVLIRAVGPTLAAAPFLLAGTMTDPRVELFRGAVSMIGNDNWGGGGEMSAAFARAGAFPLPAGSRDAALLVSLPPGSYTAQVTGVDRAAGVVIVEVYEVP